jgi:hypothetical protein
MKRYLIERDIPNVGSLSREQLKGLAVTSNDALVKLSGKVQWVHSYIAADRTFAFTSPRARAWFENTRGWRAFR